MSLEHLQELEARLKGKGWTVAAIPGDDMGICERWRLSLPGRGELTLNIDEGMDDLSVLSPKKSYACHVDGQVGISLCFSKNRREWLKNLGEFVNGLEQAAASNGVSPTQTHVLGILPAPEESGGYDFGIDGVPLGKWMGRWTGKAPEPGPGQNIPTWVREDLLRLAGKRVSGNGRLLASGRTPVYICSQCGSLGCGCFAVRVAFCTDVVTWSDFSIDGDFAVPGRNGSGEYADVPILHFERTAYLSALSALL